MVQPRRNQPKGRHIQTMFRRRAFLSLQKIAFSPDYGMRYLPSRTIGFRPLRFLGGPIYTWFRLPIKNPPTDGHLVNTQALTLCCPDGRVLE